MTPALSASLAPYALAALAVIGVCTGIQFIRVVISALANPRPAGESVWARKET